MRITDKLIYLRMPWWCDCHEPTCHECVIRYFNHKGMRCNSPLLITGGITGKWWNLLRRLYWWNIK